jgi:hypothetical protein
MAGTATAALAATSSPTDTGTGTGTPATMTADMKIQPSQVHQATTAKTPAKAAKTSKTSAPVQAKAKAKPAAPKTPQQIATAMLQGFGWTKAQFSFLDHLWHKESNWDPTASNASSGAYGIAQALPASQMSSAGSDWQTNASTQIKWGLNYIKDRYGSPQAAWAHETAQGWY